MERLRVEALVDVRSNIPQQWSQLIATCTGQRARWRHGRAERRRWCARQCIACTDAFFIGTAMRIH